MPSVMQHCGNSENSVTLELDSWRPSQSECQRGYPATELKWSLKRSAVSCFRVRRTPGGNRKACRAVSRMAHSWQPQWRPCAVIESAAPVRACNVVRDEQFRFAWRTGRRITISALRSRRNGVEEWGDVRKREDCLGHPLQANYLGQWEFAQLIKAAKVRRITFHGIETRSTGLNVAALNTSIIISKTGYQKSCIRSRGTATSHCNSSFATRYFTSSAGSHRTACSVRGLMSMFPPNPSGAVVL